MAQSKLASEMAKVNLKSNDVFEQPQCLIYDDADTGKMEFCTDVVEQIAKIEKQLNTVAIAGLYRTGKSYLMSRLAGKYKGFPLGSTVQSKTKGIWIWCRPHPKWPNQVLLLMDSEGLGDVEKGDADHDNKLFALITLLSSTLVYNTMGVLNQEVLDKLNFITEISKNIKTSENSSDDSNLDLFFPELIIALRDYSLELVIDGEPVTADAYFEHCLKLYPVEDPAAEKKNRPRKCVRKYFKRRHCFTFERPGNKRVLRNMEEMTDDDLDEYFVTDTVTFVSYVTNSCKAMEMQNGKAITGRMFAHLLKSYVDAINEGSVPCIENAIRSMALVENAKAVEYAVQSYVDDMTKKLKLPVKDVEALTSINDECIKFALTVFHKHAIRDEDEKFLNKANGLIWNEFEGFKRQNDKASEDVCRKLLQKLHQPIREGVMHKKYTAKGGYKKYKNDFQKLQEEYQKSTELGVKKSDIWCSFIEETRTEGELVLRSDEEITASEQMNELERQKREEAEQKSQARKEKITRQKQEQTDLKKQTQENIRQLQAKYESDLNTSEENNKKVLEARLNEQSRLLTEKHEKEAQQTQMEINKLQEESKKNREENERRIGELASVSYNRAADSSVHDYAAGAATGALIGSALGPLGTVVGGFLGGWTATAIKKK